MATFVQTGLEELVKRIISDPAQGLQNSTLRLFKNDVSPTVDTVAADLTQADYVGYAPVTLNAWSNAVAAPPNAWKSTANQGIFAVTPLNPAQDVYGWYIQNGNGVLMGAARFTGAPLNLGGTTIAIGITPSFSEAAS